MVAELGALFLVENDARKSEKNRPSSGAPERGSVLRKSLEHARSTSIRHSELDSESALSIVRSEIPYRSITG